MTVQNVQHYFSHSYVGARELLGSLARQAGLEVNTHRHPLRGPAGEELATDTILIGNPDADNLVVLISGTHGVETLCGSACQAAYIASEQWRALEEDTAVLIIHALNCWGAAHLRRNNEDNVDLARNFLNFNESLPENAAYEAVREPIDCTEYRGRERDRVNKLHGKYIAANGIPEFVNALMGGQYDYSNGFAFGGKEAVWSNHLLREILRPFSKASGEVRVVEYHSGLGPYGYGMAVTMQSGDDLARVRQLYGHWVDAPNENSDSKVERFHRVTGHTVAGVIDAFPSAKLSAIVLEFGTYPPFESLQVLLDDHWLTHYGDPTSDLAKEIKQKILEYHYPADPDWRQAVADRSRQVIEQSFRGLEKPQKLER